MAVTAWYSTSVFRILRDPRLAGFAVTGSGSGKEILYADGVPMSAHEGIVLPAEWWRLQDVLNGRAAVPKQRKGGTVTLLAGSGLLRCDVCGSAMLADMRGGTGYYRCMRPRGSVAGHGGMAVNREIVDDTVARRVWARLGNLDMGDPTDRELLAEASTRFAAQQDSSELEAERAAANAELEHVRAALRTLYSDRQEGLYDGSTGRAMFAESVTRLTAHEERTAARVASLAAPEVPAEWLEYGEHPTGPGSMWARWTIAEQRQFLGIFLDAVRITPAKGRGHNAKTAERIELDWA
jgi:hypothetical protein